MMRAIFYGDPMEVAMRLEQERIGCLACQNHVKRADGRGYRCLQSCPDWPTGLKGICGGWRVKKLHVKKN